GLRHPDPLKAAANDATGPHGRHALGYPVTRTLTRDALHCRLDGHPARIVHNEEAVQMVHPKHTAPTPQTDDVEKTLSKLLKQVESEPVSRELADLALQLKLAVEARNRDPH
ncbi:hypothetical protein, partial [Pararhodobacter marinus]|uniref:hypothetical protein n=2 Tax=Pararhodobacter marinus TaxID=2184063 RepID=UPI0035131A53